MTPSEEWRPVPEFPGYEASSFGRVRSWRPNGGGWAVNQTPPATPRLLRLTPAGRYLSVTLRRDGKPCRMAVHRVVAAAFLGPCPKGLQVCHTDDDGTNNVVANLRYDTPRANIADQIRRGRNSMVAASDLMKTCKSGQHPWTADNIGIRTRPNADPTQGRGAVHRYCRECSRIAAVKRSRARRERLKQQADVDGDAGRESA